MAHELDYLGQCKQTEEWTSDRDKKPARRGCIITQIFSGYNNVKLASEVIHPQSMALKAACDG